MAITFRSRVGWPDQLGKGCTTSVGSPARDRSRDQMKMDFPFHQVGLIAVASNDTSGMLTPFGLSCQRALRASVLLLYSVSPKFVSTRIRRL